MEYFDEFLNLENELLINLRRKFIKFAFKYEIYEFSKRVYKSRKQDNHTDFSTPCEWVENDILLYKNLLQNARDNCKQVHNETMIQTSGLFSSFMNLLSSGFGKLLQTTSNSQNSQLITPENVTIPEKPIQNKNYDFIVKDYIEGYSSNLKRKFNDSIISHNFQQGIGVEFFCKMYSFGKLKSKLQLWNVSGTFAGSIVRTYYRGVFLMVLIIDPFNDSDIGGLKEKKQHILDYSSKGMEIVIVTQKDPYSGNQRILSNDQVDLMAFDEFNCFHIDIADTDTESPQCIAIYSILLKYIMNMDQHTL